MRGRKPLKETALMKNKAKMIGSLKIVKNIQLILAWNLLYFFDISQKYQVDVNTYIFLESKLNKYFKGRYLIFDSCIWSLHFVMIYYFLRFFWFFIPKIHWLKLKGYSRLAVHPPQKLTLSMCNASKSQVWQILAFCNLSPMGDAC